MWISLVHWLTGFLPSKEYNICTLCDFHSQCPKKQNQHFKWFSGSDGSSINSEGFTIWTQQSVTVNVSGHVRNLCDSFDTWPPLVLLWNHLGDLEQKAEEQQTMYQSIVLLSEGLPGPLRSPWYMRMEATDDHLRVPNHSGHFEFGIKQMYLLLSIFTKGVSNFGADY